MQQAPLCRTHSPDTRSRFGVATADVQSHGRFLFFGERQVGTLSILPKQKKKKRLDRMKRPTELPQSAPLLQIKQNEEEGGEKKKKKKVSRVSPKTKLY